MRRTSSSVSQERNIELTKLHLNDFASVESVLEMKKRSYIAHYYKTYWSKTVKGLCKKIYIFMLKTERLVMHCEYV